MRPGIRDRVSSWVPVVLGTVFLLLLPSAALGAGQLDPTFDGDGKVVTDLGESEGGGDVAVQADGKIVVVGGIRIVANGPVDFAVARYNPDGSLDTSFDGDGKVVTDFGGTNDEASAVAVQAADGKIVAAGTTVPGVHRFDFALARYNADGSLDPSFDGDGRVTTDFAK